MKTGISNKFSLDDCKEILLHIKDNAEYNFVSRDERKKGRFLENCGLVRLSKTGDLTSNYCNDGSPIGRFWCHLLDPAVSYLRRNDFL